MDQRLSGGLPTGSVQCISDFRRTVGLKRGQPVERNHRGIRQLVQNRRAERRQSGGE
jgi:hypothetical protein